MTNEAIGRPQSSNWGRFGILLTGLVVGAGAGYGGAKGYELWQQQRCEASSITTIYTLTPSEIMQLQANGLEVLNGSEPLYAKLGGTTLTTILANTERGGKTAQIEILHGPHSTIDSTEAANATLISTLIDHWSNNPSLQVLAPVSQEAATASSGVLQVRVDDVC